MHTLKTTFMTFFLSMMAFMVNAAPSNTGGSTAMGKIKAKVESKDYRAAIIDLKDLVAKDSKNANAYNLLGFSHRKLQQYDVAESYYQKALALNPEHVGALEYLGELYLETDRPEKAQEMLERLDDACFFQCKEYEILEKLIAGHDGIDLADQY